MDSIVLKCMPQVVVSTKSPKTDKQYVWEADADSSSYVIKEETDPEKLITRGTQITLFLRVSSPDCNKLDNIL
jgi:HSP90 family molecular chaperone